MNNEKNQDFPEFVNNLILIILLFHIRCYLGEHCSAKELSNKNMIRFINYLMISIFVLAAIVQYNDPQPLRWMLMYGAAALVCILYALKKLHWVTASTIVFISGVWTLLKIPQLTVYGFQHMFDDVYMIQTGVEAAREFLGLIIIFIWATTLGISTYREKRKKIPTYE